MTITDSYPSSDTQWLVAAIENDATPGNWRLTAFAVCAVVS